MSDSLTQLIQDTYRAITPGVDADGNLVPTIPARAAPSDLNGTLLDIDMSKPQDFTGVWGKVVIDDGGFSLRGTIVYRLWCAQGCPAERTAVTLDHLRLAADYAINDMARWQIYKILSDSGVELNFRPSDTVTNVLFTPEMIIHLRPSADRFHQTINESEQGRARVAEAGYKILLSLYANAIHRCHCNGHNWFTADQSKPRTHTRRCLAVAGPDIEAFSVYMEKHGHEANHHLTDACLENICDVIAGMTVMHYPDDDTSYGGREIGGMAVHEILRVTESATDRWPASQLGKSAMIVALDLITSMYTHMSTTLLITGADMVATAAAQLSSSMKSNTFTREMIRNASSIIANLVSLVFGYCVHANLVEDERYIALKRHAERNPAMVASGKALAIAVMRAVPNKNAVTAGVRSSVMTLASTISSMSGLTNDADAIRIISTFDSTKVTTEAGKDEQVSLMELLKTVRGEKPEPAPSPPTNIA